MRVPHIDMSFIMEVGKGNLISSDRTAQFKFEMQMSCVADSNSGEAGAFKLEVNLQIYVSLDGVIRFCAILPLVATWPLRFISSPIIHTFSHVSKSSRGQAMLSTKERGHNYEIIWPFFWLRRSRDPY